MQNFIFGIITRYIINTQSKKKSFTLAEVLITLALIGVISSLTVPNMLANMQEKELVTALKKTNAELAQAYITVKLDNGEPTNWNVTNYYDIAKYFKPYLNIQTMCDEDINRSTHISTGCDHTLNYNISFFKNLSNNDGGGTEPVLKLTNGTILSFYHQVSVENGLDCNWGAGGACFMIHADVNGKKPPNRYGVDIFTFQANKTVLKPRGAPDTHGTYLCDPRSDVSTAGWPNGSACGSWVIREGNMDYLKCIDKGQTEYCRAYK